MATTYDKASLVMIPSGVKEDKLYSIKPTDGSGDFTFSRGTDTATRVNASGLIEKERANLFTYSNDFSNAAWTKVRSSVSSGSADPFGGSNAWSFLADTSANQQHYFNATISESGVGTLSLYAKANGYNWLRLRIPSEEAYFDLANGVTGSSTTGISASMTDAGGGWYRCEVAISDMSSSASVFFHIAEGDGDIIIGGTPSGTDGLFIYGAQLNQGLVAQPYIETTTAAVYEGITDNLPRLDYSGGASCPSLLLEPSRTNLFEHSDYLSASFWIDDQITRVQNTTDTLSPEGVYNAVKLTETATTARHRLASGVITISNTTYTASVFLKKGTARYGFVHLSGANAYTIVVDLEDGTITDTATNSTIAHQSVEDYGNGWYRCSVAGNMASVTTAYIVQFGTAGSAEPTYNNYVPQFLGSTSNNIYAYGAQLEAGSYPTSIIPTYGTSASRAADDFVLNLATDIVQNGGTFMIELVGDVAGSGSSIPFLQFTHTNASSYVGFGATANWRCRINDNGTSRLVTSPVAHTENVKLCIRYGDFGYQYYANGSSFSTYTTAINIGDFTSVNFVINENYGILRIKQLLTFPTALTDSEAIALTTL